MARYLLPVLLAPLLLACDNERQATLGERLQGNWKHEGTSMEGEYQRNDFAAMEVRESSLKYSYNSLWDCTVLRDLPDGTKTPDCRAGQPKGRGGYFEGIYEIVHDSLKLMDGTDTVSIRNLKSDSFDFILNGSVFPMTRN